MTVLHDLPVHTGSRNYNITIGHDLLGNIGEYLKNLIEGRNVFILSDEATLNLYAEKISRSIGNGVEVLSVPSGEASKSWEQLQRVTGWMLDNGVDRHSVLVAVGGGVVGDLGGFAAASVMRGIDFIQVPTTLLAQVDSSVGGKTGINVPQGKNLVGAFHQPVHVLCDLDVLKTLPERHIKAGYAEVVKYGLISDPEFFIWLEGHGNGVCNLQNEALAKAISVSCRKKAEIVAQDEKEKGMRALLNLGHTFGHALEAATRYDGRLLHGEAVSIGIVLAFQLSQRMGLCEESDVQRVEDHFTSVGLPTRMDMIEPSLSCGAEEIIDLMKMDKKVKAGKNVFVLVRGIGQAYQESNVNDEDVLAVIKQSL